MKKAKPTFQKRQKELARIEKKKAKQDRLAAARRNRAEQREANPDTFDIEMREDLTFDDDSALRELMSKSSRSG